jgi:hypothetical protein
MELIVFVDVSRDNRPQKKQKNEKGTNLND